MLSVNRDPFLRIHACGEPEPKTIEVSNERMQDERSMGHRTMQVECDAHDGEELIRDDGVGHDRAKGEVEQTTREIPVHVGPPCEIGIWKPL